MSDQSAKPDANAEAEESHRNFELWVLSNHEHSYGPCDFKREGDGYAYCPENDLWKAWEASRISFSPAPSSEERAIALHASPDFYGSLEDARAAVQAEDEREGSEKSVGETIRLQIPQPPAQFPTDLWGYGYRKPEDFRWLPVVVSGFSGVSGYKVLMPDGRESLISGESYAASTPMDAALSQTEPQGGGAVEPEESVVFEEGRSEGLREGKGLHYEVFQFMLRWLGDRKLIDLDASDGVTLDDIERAMMNVADPYGEGAEKAFYDYFDPDGQWVRCKDAQQVELLIAARVPVRRANRGIDGDEAETNAAAWEWMYQTYPACGPQGDPHDHTYVSEDMIAAFAAGRATRSTPVSDPKDLETELRGIVALTNLDHENDRMSDTEQALGNLETIASRLRTLLARLDKKGGEE